MEKFIEDIFLYIAYKMCSDSFFPWSSDKTQGNLPGTKQETTSDDNNSLLERLESRTPTWIAWDSQQNNDMNTPTE